MYFSGHGYSFSSVTASVTRKEGYNMSRRKRITPYEQAIRYLSQVEYIDMMISEKQDIIESMRSSVTGTSARIDNERVQTSPKDKLGETCAKIADLCTQVNNDIDDLLSTKAEVMQTIDSYVDNLKERKVLYMKYLKFVPIDTCAKELGVSRRTAYNLHRSGVFKIANKFTNLHKVAHTDA